MLLRIQQVPFLPVAIVRLQAVMLYTSITNCIVTINTDIPDSIVSYTIFTSSTTTASTGTTAGSYSYCYLHSPYGVPSMEAVNGGRARAVFRF